MRDLEVLIRLGAVADQCKAVASQCHRVGIADVPLVRGAKARTRTGNVIAMSHAEAEVEAPEADQRTTVGSNRHRRVRAGLVREGADTRARAGRINAVG